MKWFVTQSTEFWPKLEVEVSQNSQKMEREAWKETKNYGNICYHKSSSFLIQNFIHTKNEKINKHRN